MATSRSFGFVSAAEFIEMDFGPDRKAELDCGTIRIMAGGTVQHARIQANIMGFLHAALRGSGCRPYGSDMAINTHAASVRYPDVSILCGHSNDPENDKLKMLTDPKVIIEVLSDSTRAEDEGIKLREYQAMPSVECILFIDPDSERVRLLKRLSPTVWHDERFPEPTDITVPALSITLPHAEIFARD